MSYLLTTSRASIYDGAEAVGQSLLACNDGQQSYHMRHKRVMRVIQIIQAGHVQAWYNQQVYPRLGVDVLEHYGQFGHMSQCHQSRGHKKVITSG